MNTLKTVSFENPAAAPSEETSSFSIRHRKRPGAIHQNLVVASLIGDLIAIVLAVGVAYLVRFETVLGTIGCLLYPSPSPRDS